MASLLNSHKYNKTVSSLNLSKNYLKDDGVKLLADAIIDYPIVALNLSNNELSYKGVHHLCSVLALGGAPGLVHLCLSNVEALQKNRIGWQGGKTLGELLRMQIRDRNLLKL
jgi:hypothetical protein